MEVEAVLLLLAVEMVALLVVHKEVLEVEEDIQQSIKELRS